MLLEEGGVISHKNVDTPDDALDKDPVLGSLRDDTAKLQLLLADKRTALAVMRTGIAIFTLPLSVVTVLIATSRYYHFEDNWHFIVPLMTVNTLLVSLAMYLVGRSFLRLLRVDRLIHKVKSRGLHLADLVEGS